MLREVAIQRCRTAALLMWLATSCITPCTQGLAQDSAYARRLYFEKANCDFCHGWAGDGAGQGQAPAGANLRETSLNRDQLVMVISCGVPGTEMPHFDELAYTDKRCYGMTEAELGSRTPPFPTDSSLPKREIEVIADYLLATVVGRGPITREECFGKLGEHAGSCNDYPSGSGSSR